MGDDVRGITIKTILMMTDMKINCKVRDDKCENLYIYVQCSK